MHNTVSLVMIALEIPVRNIPKQGFKERTHVDKEGRIKQKSSDYKLPHILCHVLYFIGDSSRFQGSFCVALRVWGIKCNWLSTPSYVLAGCIKSGTPHIIHT